MGDWRIAPLVPEDKAEVYDLLLKHFFVDEPATCRLFQRHGPPPLESCPGILAFRQTHSFKAVSTASGEVVGVALSYNEETLPPWKPAKGEPMDSLMKFFSYIEEKTGGAEEGWLTLQILAVRDDWRRKGIAEALVRRTEEEAEKSQYKGCKVTCTSAFSARLMGKLGWKQTHALQYSDYPDPIFQYGPPHLAVQVFCRRI